MAAETRPADHLVWQPWLTPGIRGIGTASLLADLGHEVPTALLPSLLTSALGAPAAALGVIEASRTAWRGSRVWAVERWRTIPPAGARSRSADTQRPRFSPA